MVYVIYLLVFMIGIGRVGLASLDTYLARLQ
jgi:hypothetical protein